MPSVNCSNLEQVVRVNWHRLELRPQYVCNPAHWPIPVTSYKFSTEPLLSAMDPSKWMWRIDSREKFIISKYSSENLCSDFDLSITPHSILKDSHVVSSRVFPQLSWYGVGSGLSILWNQLHQFWKQPSRRECVCPERGKGNAKPVQLHGSKWPPPSWVGAQRARLRSHLPRDRGVVWGGGSSSLL